MFLISLGTASAKDKAENVTGTAQNTTRENPDTRMPHRNVAKPELEIKEDDLLAELIKPESASKRNQTVKEDPCSSIKCTSDTTK
jgi:aldehyde:ferredoxin oxidoreductase